jgi:peptidyl-prolyl cis-trans isomerase B (cyclophilin B)
MTNLRAALLALVLCCAPALAQLTPDRLYYGINRSIPMKVTLPEGKAGDLRIELFSSEQNDSVAKAAVEKGGVDLAALFPTLWTTKSPRLQYAQLVVGEERLGAPVVLQPMVNPMAAMLYNEPLKQPWFIDPKTTQPNFKPREGQVAWVSNETRTYTGIRAYVDKHVVFETSLGEIEFRLDSAAAPNTAYTVMHLVEGGFYTEVIFHRVVPRTLAGSPFVIQVGDPTGTGDGGPGFSIDLEPSTLQHDFGVISMARETEPNTNGSQVFVCLSREGTKALDGRYTAFGYAVRGAETILSIAATPLIPDEAGKDPKNRPKDPPVLLRAKLVDAPPYGQAPARVMRPVEQPKDR